MEGPENQCTDIIVCCSPWFYDDVSSALPPGRVLPAQHLKRGEARVRVVGNHPHRAFPGHLFVYQHLVSGRKIPHVQGISGIPGIEGNNRQCLPVPKVRIRPVNLHVAGGKGVQQGLGVPVVGLGGQGCLQEQFPKRPGVLFPGLCLLRVTHSGARAGEDVPHQIFLVVPVGR